MRLRSSAPICAAVLALAVGVSSCGSAQRVTTTTPAKTSTATKVVDVYSSLPLTGPEGAEGRAIRNGIEVGLAEEAERIPETNEFRVISYSGYTISYRSLNDATRAGWSPTRVESNAEEVAADPRAVLYIGDLNSGATEISLPVLNQAGIVQITPGSGYPGLTNKVPDNVTRAGEPDKFYPNAGLYSLLRLIPDDTVQAAAVLAALSAAPTACKRVAAHSFGSNLDGPALVAAVKATAGKYHMTYVTSDPALPATASNGAELKYAEDLKSPAVQAQCLVLAGRPTARAVALVKIFHDELPTDPIITTSDFCHSRFTNSRDGGIALALDPYVSCISPVLPLSRYGSASAAFIADYRARFARQTPSPYAAYGYVAGDLTSTAIGALGYGIDDRTAVQNVLLGGGEHDTSLMSELYFDSHGNLASRNFGLFHIVDGVPVLQPKLITPSKLFGPE